MARCFVIQPFDSGPFDDRYEDVFAPAIREAGLEPYRVDKDPESVVLIDSIEQGIRDSAACLADITTDNPNVWFEVGFAFASGKPVVLVCGPRTDPFPFDVNQRPIVRYETQTPRDFTALKAEVTKRLRAQVERQQQMQSLAQVSPLQESKGLSPHEMAVMVCLAESQEGPEAVLSAPTIHRQMESAGFTGVAANISIAALIRKGYVESSVQRDSYEEWRGYTLTESGMEWLFKNQSLVSLRHQPAPVGDISEFGGSGDDSDTPF